MILLLTGGNARAQGTMEPVPVEVAVRNFSPRGRELSSPTKTRLPNSPFPVKTFLVIPVGKSGLSKAPEMLAI